MKISSEQKADIVRRIQVKNPDGTWAVSYKALAPQFGVSSCLISHIAKHAGLPQRKRGKYVPFVGKRYQPPGQLSDMYQELRGKVGMTEARRLIEDRLNANLMGKQMTTYSQVPLHKLANIGSLAILAAMRHALTVWR
jgi:hypothetical protein